jgi:apolipoprotein D and lipocalin family protein
MPNLFWILLLCVGLVGCQSWTDSCGAEAKPPLRAIERPVDLQRFMGDWYVIAHIPTFIEDEAFNGVESYRLDTDGTIATTYVFNNGGFDGPLKTYRPPASSITARPTPNGGCSSSGRSRPPT